MQKYLKKIGFVQVAFFLILFFGVCLRIFTPPFQGMDEQLHFARAWQVSEGIFLSPAAKVRDIENENNPMILDIIKKSSKIKKLLLHSEDEKFLVAEIPRSMISPDFTFNFGSKFNKVNFEMTKNFLLTSIDSTDTEFVLIPTTGQYPPLAYFPQATAAFIGRSLNLNAGEIYYFMCFAALLFVAVCVLISMKLLPEKKFLIFLLAMMPMFLVEIISTSADAVTYGICFLGTAWLLSMRNKFDEITGKEIFALIILAICLGLLKSVYGTILLLYFLMPRQRFKKISAFIGLGIFLLFTALAASGLWIYFSITAKDVEMFSKFYLGYDDVDIVAQKNFIIENPKGLLVALFNTLTYSEGDIRLVKSFVGMLGRYKIYLPNYFVLGYSIILITLGGFCGKLNLRFWQRIFIFLGVFASIIGVLTVEYLIWTSVGGELIRGLHGRYFIPIALTAFSILSFLRPPKYANLIVLLCGIFSASFAIWMTYSVFY